MIPRYQRIIFWSLAAGILLMATFLLHGCQQAHKRRAALNDATPIAAPTNTSTEDFTLYLANDAEASITPTTEQVALPPEPTLRARALLEHLLSRYALPGSAHPLQGGLAVDDVFLLTPSTQGQLAVINLRGSFIDHHPSGIQVEDLTIQSIIGTLHSALPEIKEIRFLVDGQPHETLAGHADLLRTYPAVDTTVHPQPPEVTENTPDETQP
jgi:hypothetical protein